MRIRHVALTFGFLLLAVGAARCQQILWQFTNDVPQAHFAGSPSVGDDGTIYIGTASELTNGHGLFAISPNGKQRWFFQTGVPIVSAPTIGTDGTIYFATQGGRLVAVNADGTLHWDYNSGSSDLRGFALGYDGTIYCKAFFYVGGIQPQQTKFYAFSTSGVKQWEITVADEIGPASIVVNFDGTVYFPSASKLYAVNPDGTAYWSIPQHTESVVIGADGTIYINGDASGAQSLYALNQDGTPEWFSIQSTGFLIIAADGTIYVGSLAAVSPRGFRLWFTGAGGEEAGVVSSDGTVYVPSPVGNLYAVDATGGIKWQLTLSTAIYGSPALVPEGTLYVNGDTRLYAIRVPCGLANSPWPMTGHDLKRTGRAGLGSPSCPCLGSIRLARNRGFQFTVAGELGKSYRIETSANLVTWVPWTNFVATNLVTHFTDAGATNLDRRFYRAVLP